jgi:hypothetical protein
MKNFKKVISAVVALALSATTLVSAASFTDVADTASYAEAINVLSSLGIVNGYEDGTFKPEGEITRAEAATMVVGALNMTEDAVNAAGTSQFADVNEKAAWATGYINVGVAQGFINGMGDGTFAPQANVTYAQMCVMLTSIAGYGEYASNGGYPTGYTNMAASTGINKGVAVADNTALTRGQVAQMIYNTLITPMLGVAEYSLTGNTYSQLDGKSGRAFKTLLSDKWDGYVATVAIADTPLSDTTLENDEVKIDIKKADWWYDALLPITDTNAASYANLTVLFDGADVNSNVFQTGRAVFVLDEDDEIVMKYFGATGKTRTEEFDAADYVAQTKLSSTNKYSDTNAKIRFGSKYYKIEDGAQVYANGIYVATLAANTAANAAANQATLDKFLTNAVGTVTLLDDATVAGYEKIMVDIWNVAKVAGVEYENSKTVVSMTTKNALTGYYAYDEIVIDDEELEEGKTIVYAEKNGAEVELTSLAKGDIIAYRTDITVTSSTLTNPKELAILATSDTVTGKVTAKDTEDETFTVDGTVYDAVVWNASLVNMGESYTLTLDPFGRIYAAEQEGSSDLYAIALDVTTDGYVKMILADGTTKSYALESGAIKNTAGLLSGTSESNLDTYLNTAAPNARIAKYKVRNSTGEIMSIDIVDTSAQTTWATADEFKSRTNRLGSAEILDTTPVIDARKAVLADPKAGSSYAKFDVNSFKDGVDYKFVAIKTGTYTNLVVLAAVGTKISEDSRFAVVTRAPQADITDDGDEVEVVEVLYKGEKTTLNFNQGVYTTAGLAIGEAFYFDVDSYGYVSDVFVVYDTTSKFVALDAAITAAGKTASDYVATSGEDAWNYTLSNTGSNANADIQFAAGYVVPGKDGVMTFAEATPTLTYIDSNKDHKAAGDNGVAIFAVTDDTEMYLYDTNADVVKEGDKLSVKADASVLASNALSKYEDNGVFGTDLDFNGFKDTAFGGNNTSDSVVNMASEANYAIALIVDEVVVSVYVVK